MSKAVADYLREVKEGVFPTAAYSPSVDESILDNIDG
jgi:hypothetical protein